MSCKHPWLQHYITSWYTFTACRMVLRATAKQNGLEHKTLSKDPNTTLGKASNKSNLACNKEPIIVFFSKRSYYSLTSLAHTPPLCVAAGHWVFWSGLSLHCDRHSHHHLLHSQCGLLLYSPTQTYTGIHDEKSGRFQRSSQFKRIYSKATQTLGMEEGSNLRTFWLQQG